MRDSRSSFKRIIAWAARAENNMLAFAIVVALFVAGILLMIVGSDYLRAPSASNAASSVSSSTPSVLTKSVANDGPAITELKKLAWVKDVHVSPGHMNVGVIKDEKNWEAPMIGMAVCGILKRTGSGLTRVRFVDIEKVVREQVPAQSAEITVHYCQ